MERDDLAPGLPQADDDPRVGPYFADAFGGDGRQQVVHASLANPGALRSVAEQPQVIVGRTYEIAIVRDGAAIKVAAEIEWLLRIGHEYVRSCPDRLPQVRRSASGGADDVEVRPRALHFARDAAAALGVTNAISSLSG